MKQKKLLRFAIMILLMFLQAQTIGQEVPKIRVDPSKAYGGTVSEYFENVEYIPLETTNESLFGDVYRMIVTDSGFVITDFDTRNIFFFTKKGKFLCKVKSNFSIFHDKSQNLIAFPTYTQNQTKLNIVYYSLCGRKVKDTSYSIENKSNIGLFPIPLEPNYYVGFNDCSFNSLEKKISVDYYLTIYKESKPILNLLPVKDYSKTIVRRVWGFTTPPKVITNGSFYISSPFEYEIYKVNKYSATKSFQLIFPSNRVLPQNILTSSNEKYIDSIIPILQKNTKLIADIENIFFVGSKLLFKIRPLVRRLSYNNSLNENQYNFVYDTLTGKLVTLDRIIPDSVSYYLPTMCENSKASGLISFDSHLYSYLSSLQMFAAKEATKGKKINYPSELKIYFEKENRKSNPVIVKMKLKE